MREHGGREQLLLRLPELQQQFFLSGGAGKEYTALYAGGLSRLQLSSGSVHQSGQFDPGPAAVREPVYGGQHLYRHTSAVPELHRQRGRIDLDLPAARRSDLFRRHAPYRGERGPGPSDGQGPRFSLRQTAGQCERGVRLRRAGNHYPNDPQRGAAHAAGYSNRTGQLQPPTGDRTLRSVGAGGKAVPQCPGGLVAGSGQPEFKTDPSGNDDPEGAGGDRVQLR